MAGKKFYRFGNFILEPEERRLCKNRTVMALSGKPLDILVVLIKNHGALVRKEQLLKEVWPDSYVEEGSLSVNIAAIRRVLGDSEGPEYIETVPRQGYRFTAPVTELEELRAAEVVQANRTSRSKYLFIAVAAVLLCVTVGTVGTWIASRSRSVGPRQTATEFYKQALAYEQSGDDEQAVATHERAIAADPSYPEPYLRAAFLHYELDQNERARSFLDRLASVGMPIEPSFRLKVEGLRYLLDGDVSHALETYQLLIDTAPSDTEGLYRFAEAATVAGRIPEADLALERCLNRDPLNVYCRFQMMYVRLKQNRFTEIVHSYDQMPKEIRDYPWFDEPAGIAQMGLGNIQQASLLFDRLSERQNRLHGIAHFTIGKEWQADLLLYSGRVAEADRLIRQLMETSQNEPARAAYLAYLVEIAVVTGDSPDAKRYAAELTQGPADPVALTRAAVLLAVVGDNEGVRRLLIARSSKTADPLPPPTQHLIHGFEVLDKSHANGIEEITLGYELDKSDPTAAYWLATAYLRQGDCRAALPILQAVRRASGTVLLEHAPVMLPIATIRSAQCYDRLGEREHAATLFSEAKAFMSSADPDLKRMLTVRSN